MWSQILSHSRQIEQIKKALAENKVPHAYLFSGLEGIGKKKVALGLAQALLGEKEKIKKNIHPDCILLEPDGKTIRVEQLRDLKHKAALKPLEGDAKIFIIDQAEKMTLAGANALLKILEEPPALTYFILITSKPSRLLPTIVSRCQRLEFGPLDEKIIFQKLKSLGKGESEAAILARHAQGSLQRALAFDLAFFEEIQTKLGDLRKNPRPSSILGLSEELAEEEEEKIDFFLNTLSLLAYEKIRQTEENEKLSGLAEKWLAIEKAKNKLDTTVNKRLLLESLLFKLVSP